MGVPRGNLILGLPDPPGLSRVPYESLDSNLRVARMPTSFGRKIATFSLIGALIQGTMAPAAADWSYFRLKSPTGHVIGSENPPPPQSQISYFVLGPQSGTVGQSYAATSQITGATGVV